MVSQNVEADAAVTVDVGVVDASGEVDLGRLEGVVCREVDGEEEDTTGVWRVLLQRLSELFIGYGVADRVESRGRKATGDMGTVRCVVERKG